MKSIQLAICLCAGLIYSLRMKIGSERFNYSMLSNENEKSNKQALENFFERILFSVGIIGYICMFLIISIVFGQAKDEQLIWYTLYISVLVHSVYQFYFTFYPVDKQELTGSGQSIITNLLIPFWVKRFRRLSPYQSNLFSFGLWLCIIVVCLRLNLIITAIMFSISLLSFGVVSLNFFLVETENIRKIFVGELRDKKLNTQNNKDHELLLPEKEKSKIIISKPL